MCWSVIFRLIPALSHPDSGVTSTPPCPEGGVVGTLRCPTCSLPCWWCLSPLHPAVSLPAPPSHRPFQILFFCVPIQPSIPQSESPFALTAQPPPLPTPNPSFRQCPPSQQLLLKPVLSSGQHLPTWVVLSSPFGWSSTHTQPLLKEICCVSQHWLSKSPVYLQG